MECHIFNHQLTTRDTVPQTSVSFPKKLVALLLKEFSTKSITESDRYAEIVSQVIAKVLNADYKCYQVDTFELLLQQFRANSFEQHTTDDRSSSLQHNDAKIKQ